MLEKLHRQGERRLHRGKKRPATDAALAAHAAELSARYLGGRAVPTSVRWVSNQNSRWGSATPAEGTIRLSNKLRPMPQWVIDYVLLHELAHLLVAGHNAAFWKLLEAYPETQRAKAFLEGVSFATSRGLEPDNAEPENLHLADVD
jgi:predicted metal-dependent hydrolase